MTGSTTEHIFDDTRKQPSLFGVIVPLRIDEIAKHGVGFACAGLAIGKDAAVVTLSYLYFTSNPRWTTSSPMVR